MEISEMKEVMEQFDQGANVKCRLKNCLNAPWVDTSYPAWDFSRFDYIYTWDDTEDSSEDTVDVPEEIWAVVYQCGDICGYTTEEYAEYVYNEDCYQFTMSIQKYIKAS